MEKEKEKQKIDLRVWKKVLPYVSRMKKTAALVLIFMLVSSISESIYPLFTSYAVKHFVVPESTQGLGSFFFAFAAAIVIGGIAVIIYCRNALVMEISIGRLMKKDCFVHLQKLPLSFYSH